MGDSSENTWSNNLNAPKIPHWLYFVERENFAGTVLGAVLYGIAVALFFQCMGALFGPVGRTRGKIKWSLVGHTVAMFSFATISTAMNLDLQSICNINNREFTGSSGLSTPGPLGYQIFVYSRAISFIPDIMFLLNTWLADGLLLYRCFIIYAMNYRAVAFPCLMYLASLATGSLLVYQVVQPDSKVLNSAAIIDFGVPYFSISVSLNVLLTLMIVIRLALHSREIRSVVGSSARTSGLYKAIITMLVESSALYAINFVLFIVPWALSSYVSGIFFPILAETQVVAPFLITLRIANRSALTSETIVSGSVRSSIHFGGEGDSTNDTGTLSGGNPVDLVEANGGSSGEISGGVIGSY